MSLKFRTASAADIPSIVTHVNSAYRGESAKQGWTTESDLLDGQRTDDEMIAEMITKPDSVILLAFEGDALMGSVHIEKRSPETCYLGMLTVRPQAQANGTGRALLAHAETEARTRFGSRRMEMTVITLRQELIAWYERRGYRRTGQLAPFPVHPRFGVPKVAALEMEILDKALV